MTESHTSRHSMSDSDEESDQVDLDQTGNEEIEYCAHCGAKLPMDVWCPMRTDTDIDGTLHLRSFCDDTCEDAWTDDDATGERNEET